MPRFRPGKALGAETYLTGLLSGLASAPSPHRISLHLSEEAIEWARAISRHFQLLPSKPGWQGVDLVTGAETSRHIAAVAADAVLFPLNLAVPVRVPSVVYVHDLVAHFYRRSFPGYRPAHMVLQSWFLRRSIRNAAVVACPTGAVAEEISARHGLGSGQVHVVPEAVLTHSAPAVPPAAAAGIAGRRFILQASSSLPHKDHATGVRAFGAALARLRDVGVDPALVITGEADAAYSGLRAIIAEHGVEDSVVFAGRVDRSELDWLLRNAICHLMPTLYEGFGLGLVEAQACGCPVVASDLPVLREVSEGAAIFFTPGSAAAAADALVRLVSDLELHRQIAKAGTAAVARLDWGRHALDMLGLLERACETSVQA